jgi:hypothetical protein
MEVEKVGDAISHSFVPLQVPAERSLSNSEKVEALADSLEAQLQPVNYPSDPAVFEIVNE